MYTFCESPKEKTMNSISVGASELDLGGRNLLRKNVAGVKKSGKQGENHHVSHSWEVGKCVTCQECVMRL